MTDKPRIFLFSLDLYYSEYVKDGGNENCNEENGSDILNYHYKELFALEGSAYLHLVNYSLGLKDKSYKDTSEYCNDWHQYAVCKEIKEIKVL